MNDCKSISSQARVSAFSWAVSNPLAHTPHPKDITSTRPAFRCYCCVTSPDCLGYDCLVFAAISSHQPPTNQYHSPPSKSYNIGLRRIDHNLQSTKRWFLFDVKITLSKYCGWQKLIASLCYLWIYLYIMKLQGWGSLVGLLWIMIPLTRFPYHITFLRSGIFKSHHCLYMYMKNIQNNISSC